uniref:Uncharacterized protein n=1 Tax=Panagrolaimus sp. ES5 TaxID=591445 RepID=A0AC34F4L0_9BILA
MEEKSVSTIPSTPVPQDFPPDVYKWMKNNAEPKKALKLMKVCKYFQHKNGFPYLVVKNVTSCGNIWIYQTLDGQKHDFQRIEDIPKKFWITEELELVIGQNVASILLLKTVVCNIRKLKLDNQIITLNEFKLLTDGGNVEICDMMLSTITDNNGEIVPLEDICECLPNASKIVL